MTYKTILVHLDGTTRCSERVAIASRLALDFDAHLVGVYVTPWPFPPGGLVVHPTEEMIERLQVMERRQAEDVSDLFSERTRAAGLQAAEVRRAEGDTVAALALHARYADLLIMGQADPDAARDVTSMIDFPDATVLAASRPALIIPYAGSFPRLGQHILVAWDASQQAARSVSGALPLLKRAKRVTILVVNPDRAGGHGEVPGADIALYLARHGINAEAREEHVRDIDVGNWLLSRSFDLSTDMIVMGAYGHSPVRERLFGGVTRSLLSQMTVPVLMEH